MAMQVTLVEAHPAAADGASLRLDSNSAGISIMDWTPKVGNDGDAYVDEVLTLLIAGSSHDDLASKVQALDNMIRQVPYFRSSAQQKGIFLRCQLTNESGARQALVLQARRENGTALYGAPVSPGNIVESYKLVLRRMPWWEAAADTAVDEVVVSAALGGTADFSNVPGDVPARLMPLSFVGQSGAGEVDEVWAGFRTARYGTIANFQPLLECEDGANGTDASDAVDATASGGDHVEVTFATAATMTVRSTMDQYVTNNWEHQKGRFLYLLRAKVGAGTVATVQLSSGMNGATSWLTLPRVKISSTAWLLYPLGELTLPPVPLKYTVAPSPVMPYAKFRIGAARVSGSSSLYLDCVVRIPVDEGFCHFSGAEIKYSGADNIDLAEVWQEANGEICSMATSLTLPNIVPDTSGTAPSSFSLPIGSSRLVIAAQGETASLLTHIANVKLYYVPRWAMLRGAE